MRTGDPQQCQRWTPHSTVDVASQERALEFMALRADPAFRVTRVSRV
ncbi:MAG: hypothetical protein V9F04_01005 [Dermatophilaceae bacterium]